MAQNARMRDRTALSTRPAFAACLALALVLGGGAPARSSETVPVPTYLRILAVAAALEGQVSPGDRWTMYLDGIIDTGAAARLGRLLDRKQIARATVYFNSPGGHLVEAMELGRMIRQRGYDTSVGARSPDSYLPRAGACYSACPFAFAGGVRRSLEPGSTLGVHRARNQVPVPDEGVFQGVVSDQAGDYLAEMGVSEQLLEFMAAVPHDAIRELTPKDAERLRLVNSVAPPAGAGATR
jgi:ATP-dependent protease ClpP protease subunit